MTLVEINNDKGAFCFKTFSGDNHLNKAKLFCETLTKRCSTLSAFVVKSV